MRKEITIAAEPRELRGKNEARRLRAKGSAPAVLYGAGGDAVAVAINPKEINRILHSKTGHNTIFDIAVRGGETTPVMIVDWQNDPIKENILHIDLKRIDLTARIRVKVPVHTVGDPKGVKLQGGLHELITREIEIECLPDEIPEEFTVDVSELMIGQSVRAGEIPLVGSTKLLSPPDSVISHVITIKVEAEPAAAEGAAAPAAAAEPEVIKKGKKDEEAASARREEEEVAPGKARCQTRSNFWWSGWAIPETEYENTPHNLGFRVIDRLAEENAIRVTRKENFSRVGLGTIRGKRVALAQPQTFMNLSGPAIKGLLERYGLQPDRLLLVYDELAIPWQELRIRPKGSAAGHNGVKSVIGSLGTQDFPAGPHRNQARG